MSRPSPWAVVLLACFCWTIGARAISAYEKKLELLSTIIKQDSLWRHLFLEGVVYKLDRTYYKDIIDNELLKNARYEQGTPAAVAGRVEASDEEETSSSTPSETDTRDRIVPYEFVRNIIFKRFVVGSILDMGLEVLMISFKCLLYKHMVHLIKLIYVEMKRSGSQKKAASWSGKSIDVVESILMTMGALQFTDKHMLGTLSFFDIYKTNGENMADDVRDEYANQLDKISTQMLRYVNDNCVVKPIYNEDKNKMEEQVAEMIGVFTVENLYNIGQSYAVSEDYKKMIKDSQEKLISAFGIAPRIKGMSKASWDDITHFQERQKQNQNNS